MGSSPWLVERIQWAGRCKCSGLSLGDFESGSGAYDFNAPIGFTL
jgi:hypothetical protein